MLIRRAFLSDQETIGMLIKETVQSTNLGDYSQEQVTVWSGVISVDLLKTRFPSVIQYVAEVDGRIVGMGDISIVNSELDFLYVHKDFIGKGVGSALLAQLEQDACDRSLWSLIVTSSITAKPFFLSKGFVVTKEFMKSTRGVDLKVYLMRKELLQVPSLPKATPDPER